MRRSWRSSCGAMRMAMSCLALPEAGRPTLRARRSSASVDWGMSERSSLLSGIGSAFFAGRLARADDANDFLGIVHLGRRVALKNAAFVVNCHLASKRRLPQSLECVRGADKRGHARAQTALIQLHEEVSGEKQPPPGFQLEANGAVRAIVGPAGGYCGLCNRKTGI